jgi:leucyl/phenylalanyl-tRNA--protein transferase
MHHMESELPLAWLKPGDPFPPLSQAWGPDSPAPGLLAAGQALHTDLLLDAYRQGIFPWYSQGQPVLWWSPDPRMVLDPRAFRMRRSLRQSLHQWLDREGVELVFDRDFQEVMRRCASQVRAGQQGSWIVPDIVRAYTGLHEQGLAHSAELRHNGQLLAGLYFVAIGHAVYGESMFTTVRDGSKLALCLLVSVARRHGIGMIDCQQNTRHLASLGAHEIPRKAFEQHLARSTPGPDLEDWTYHRSTWSQLPALADERPDPVPSEPT